jgi:hypothetical protein
MRKAELRSLYRAADVPGGVAGKTPAAVSLWTLMK